MNNRNQFYAYSFVLAQLGFIICKCPDSQQSFKEQTLKTVLKEIESQTGLSIIYQKNEINENKRLMQLLKILPS